jgi:hypothetical protein
MSGYVRAQAKAGKLSVVNLLQMKGINLDGSWPAIQTLPDDFQIDEPGEF